MKIIFISMFLATSFLSQAQKEEFNTKIENVKTLNIYGNGKTIIGKVVINQGLPTEIYLVKSSQRVDSTGQYVTDLKFGIKEAGPVFNVQIIAEFDKKVIFVKPVYGIWWNV